MVTDEDWSLEPPQPWMDRSICPSVDPELFFPPQSRSDRARWAKWVCQQCPPVEDCRRYAIERPELDGVWGGTTERERRQARKEQQ